MSRLTIFLGNKTYSSWSLRPWLALHHVGVPFDEVVIRLDQPDTREQLLRHSPSGRVPALRDDGLILWESLAICEHLAERFPEAHLWPEDRAARARARAVSCEMHAGFAALRSAMPMNLQRPVAPVAYGEAAQADLDRIVALWSECRAAAPDGAFLFGRFSIADAMFAPVVTRFHTYAVQVPPVAAEYMTAIRATPGMLAWTAAAATENRRIEKYEVPAK